MICSIWYWEEELRPWERLLRGRRERLQKELQFPVPSDSETAVLRPTRRRGVFGYRGGYMLRGKSLWSC